MKSCQYAPGAEILKNVISSDVIKPASNEDIAIYREIVEVRDIEEWAKLRRELLEFKLKGSIGSTAGIQGVATWRTEDRERFDQAEFKERSPDLYEEFRRASPIRHSAWNEWRQS